MILLPYYLHNKPITGTSAIIRSLHLLTVGGTELWEEEDALRIVEDVLEPNGLFLMKGSVPTRLSSSTKIYLCPIDPQRTAVHDFFRWNEIPKDNHTTICWRTFYRCGSSLIPDTEWLSTFSVREVCGWIDKSFVSDLEHFNLNT